MQLDNPMLDFSATSAALGGACRNTVKQFVRSGKLAPATRLGRRLYWRASEVAEAVERIMGEGTPEDWRRDSDIAEQQLNESVEDEAA